MVAAIFILVILASLGAFVVSVTTTQNITLAQDVQGARAYQAARAGLESGIANWLSTSPSLAANCASTGASVSMTNLGYSFDLVATYSTSSSVLFCELVATARPTGMTSANVGSIGYVERQLQVVVEGN